jgi:hypothetical protein
MKKMFLVFKEIIVAAAMPACPIARKLKGRPHLPQQLRRHVVTADTRSLALQSAHTLNYELRGGIYGSRVSGDHRCHRHCHHLPA